MYQDKLWLRGGKSKANPMPSLALILLPFPRHLHHLRDSIDKWLGDLHIMTTVERVFHVKGLSRHFFSMILSYTKSGRKSSIHTSLKQTVPDLSVVTAVTNFGLKFDTCPGMNLNFFAPIWGNPRVWFDSVWSPKFESYGSKLCKCK